MKNRILNHLYIFLYNISPKLLLRIRFLMHYNYYKKTLSFKDPITLDEKLQWMKLNYYNNNPLITQCADKYAVREFVKAQGCEETLIELYGAYDNASEIPWEQLPNKFVIKWNFGCGQNFICKDKSKFNFEEVKKLLNEWSKDRDRFYKYGAEMQYKPIVPKIIIERLIEPESGGAPVDYKIYCFHGKAYCMLTCTGREQGKPKFYFVDRDWNLLRLNRAGKEAPENFVPEKPEGYEQLFDYAEKLSKHFPFVRADFYLDYGKVIFGELTFTPCNGFDSNRLFETNELFGDMLDIKDLMKQYK